MAAASEPDKERASRPNHVRRLRYVLDVAREYGLKTLEIDPESGRLRVEFFSPPAPPERPRRAPAAPSTSRRRRSPFPPDPGMQVPTDGYEAATGLPPPRPLVDNTGGPLDALEDIPDEF